MTPKGGTELLIKNLHKYVDNDLLSKVNLIPSVCRPEFLSDSKPNVLWQHLSYDQENVAGMNDPNFVDGIDCFLFVSQWQLSQFQERFNFPLEKCVVMHNAIEPIEFKPKSNEGKLKLIYTSTPWRGLEVLLDTIDLLNRDDIELDVYSSTVIYGVNFMKNAYDHLFNRCRATKNVNYKGYATNKAVRLAVQNAHIFSYPSTFEETSCLSAIEAGAAGCKLVLTDYGALSETCGVYASYVNYSDDRTNLVNDYADLLNYHIDNYSTEFLQEQSAEFNETYSWHNRKLEWETLIKNL